MKERAFRADAREAKGLHDGSIGCLVRVVEWEWMEGQNPNFSGYTPGPYFTGHPETGWVLRSRGNGCWNDRTKPAHSPFGAKGDRLHSICEPTDPCEHRGCLSHVTHVCEGCGRGHAGIFLDVTDVRVVRLKEIAIEDARAVTGCRDPFPLATLVQSLTQKHVNPWGRNLWLWLGTVQKVEL